MDMKLRYWFLIICIIGGVGLVVAYAFLPGAKPVIHDAFMSAWAFASGQALAFSDWFQTLPHWPAIGMGIAFIFGNLFWYKIDTIQHALHFWGYRKATRPLTGLPPLQTAPLNPTPQQIYTNPDIQQTQQLEETQQQ